MNQFNELINNGIASRRTINTKSNEKDAFIRYYNNIWGNVSNTHMGKTEDGLYVITGSLIQDQKQWETFLYSTRWRGCDFSSGSNGFASLSSYLSKNCFTGTRTLVNGAYAYVLNIMDTRPIQNCTCGCGCLTIYNVEIDDDCIALVAACSPKEAVDTLMKHPDAKELKREELKVTERFVNLDKPCVICFEK